MHYKNTLRINTILYLEKLWNCDIPEINGLATFNFKLCKVRESKEVSKVYIFHEILSYPATPHSVRR